MGLDGLGMSTLRDEQGGGRMPEVVHPEGFGKAPGGDRGLPCPPAEARVPKRSAPGVGEHERFGVREDELGHVRGQQFLREGGDDDHGTLYVFVGPNYIFPPTSARDSK